MFEIVRFLTKDGFIVVKEYRETCIILGDGGLNVS
jgi:hypothetical protein